MSEQNTADNWRLEDTGETLDQWKLQEAEQTQMAQWQLQRSRAAEAGWQPVDYERQAPRRGSWVLPSLVGVALVAVFAYGVWIGLGALGMTNLANSFPDSLTGAATPTAAAVAVADPGADATATALAAVPPTPEPTATATMPPTNTPTPEPTATPEPPKVEQVIVRITAAGGLNGRREPSPAGEVAQVLPVGQEFYSPEQRDDGWMQVALETKELLWISSDPTLVQIRSELMPLDVVNERRAALGLPPLDASAAVSGTVAGLVDTAPRAGGTLTATTPVESTPGVTTTQLPTVTQPLTPPLVTQPTTPTVALVITGTVNITAGLNARSVPTTTGEAVSLLVGGDVVTITGRSADSQWLQIRLADNTEAWVFAQYIDIRSTPVTPPATTAPITPTTPVTTTPAITTSVPSPPTGGTGQTATASVNSLGGANARLQPDRNLDAVSLVPYDTVLTVRGRSANNEWLQVDYQNQTVWVLVTTVSLSANLESIPVVTP
ncbi:MAG: SH3 domain-containing protein [Caldilinea sp. CFX5]|nr:SH3 domain-containing protein [Caldilinea sp. CFX5]